MKKTFIILCALALALTGCQQKETIFQQVADGYPIIPLRLHADAEVVDPTDYVPALVGQPGVAKSLYIEDNGTIQLMTFTDCKTEISIPVLPNLPYRNALICVGTNDTAIILQKPADAVGDMQYMTFLQNRALCDCGISEVDGLTYIRLPKEAKSGRSFLRVYAADGAYNYNDILIPLEDGKPVTSASQLNRHDENAQVLYSLMIDRFENGNPDNDWKINSPEVLDIVDFQGGDFAGITKKINEGWFNALGITTVWVSPIVQNPWDAWGCYKFRKNFDGTYLNKFDNTKSYTKFSGYHGYWPISITNVDKRFGTEEEFRTMLDAAHAHGLNVIVDYVANHMHISAPTYKEHPDWHTDSILPDGRRNFELWDEARLTTWFDEHIPTLDLEREDVYEPMTDSAMYWIKNFDIDGFRHDACKHIPLCYWRTLGRKMAKTFPNRHVWMIGETYGNPELISSYVKSGMIPAQFDFNIYHKAIDVLGKPNQDMREMAEVIEQGLAAYGAHHTMGNISGNHDKCRFISLAGGAVRWDENDKEAGWSRWCGVTVTNDPVRRENAYRAAMLLEVLNLTLPGVPCIYQGDEFAAAGANDPDNRQMMRFSGYNPRQNQFRNELVSLIQQRRQSMPLMYGDYIPVSCDENCLVFDRVYLGETVRVTIDKSDMSYKIENL